MLRRMTLMVLVSAICGCTASRENLRKRAVFEFECPAEQLTFTDLDQQSAISMKTWETLDESVGVTGCGKKAVYISRKGVWQADTVQAPPQR